jgi:hypothetical protein
LGSTATVRARAAAPAAGVAGAVPGPVRDHAVAEEQTKKARTASAKAAGNHQKLCHCGSVVSAVAPARKAVVDVAGDLRADQHPHAVGDEDEEALRLARIAGVDFLRRRSGR